MARPRITVSHDDDISPIQAMMAAGHAIAHWQRESDEGRYWSPGAIAIYDHPDLGPDAIATSTRKTRAGWSVVMFKQTTEETNATAPTAD